MNCCNQCNARFNQGDSLVAISLGSVEFVNDQNIMFTDHLNSRMHFCSHKCLSDFLESVTVEAGGIVELLKVYKETTQSANKGH